MDSLLCGTYKVSGYGEAQIYGNRIKQGLGWGKEMRKYRSKDKKQQI